MPAVWSKPIHDIERFISWRRAAHAYRLYGRRMSESRKRKEMMIHAININMYEQSTKVNKSEESGNSGTELNKTRITKTLGGHVSKYLTWDSLAAALYVMEIPPPKTDT